MFLICFALGCDSSEGKQKCCVSRAYAVCWVTPDFWENALTAETPLLLEVCEIIVVMMDRFLSCFIIVFRF